VALPVEGQGCSRWNSLTTSRDRCSVAEATLREVINGMQHATAPSTIRFFTGSPRGNENDGE
jgi:hypothetical protein